MCAARDQAVAEHLDKLSNACGYLIRWRQGTQTHTWQLTDALNTLPAMLQGPSAAGTLYHDFGGADVLQQVATYQLIQTIDHIMSRGLVKRPQRQAEAMRSSLRGLETALKEVHNNRAHLPITRAYALWARGSVLHALDEPPAGRAHQLVCRAARHAEAMSAADAHAKLASCVGILNDDSYDFKIWQPGDAHEALLQSTAKWLERNAAAGDAAELYKEFEDLHGESLHALHAFLKQNRGFRCKHCGRAPDAACVLKECVRCHAAWYCGRCVSRHGVWVVCGGLCASQDAQHVPVSQSCFIGYAGCLSVRSRPRFSWQ